MSQAEHTDELLPELIPDYSEAAEPAVYARSVERVSKVLNFLWQLNVVGLENVPREGAGILAFTHRTNLDLFALGVTAPRAITGYGKKQIKKVPPAAKYLQRRGVRLIDRNNVTPEDISVGMSAINNGQLFAIAPEGTRNQGDLIGPTKNGAGLFALKAERDGIPCPVIPVAIDSEHIYRGVFRRHLSIVYGEPLQIDLSKPGKPRKLMEDFNSEVHQGMQEVFDTAVSLRQAWLPNDEIKIPRQ